jgi:hypothetical protein
MTGDLVFDLCIASILLAILGVGTLIGYAVGNHLGVKKVQQELLRNGWAANGWQYTEQKR